MIDQKWRNDITGDQIIRELEEMGRILRESRVQANPCEELYLKLRKRYGWRMTDKWMLLKAWSERFITREEHRKLQKYISEKEVQND